MDTNSRQSNKKKSSRSNANNNDENVLPHIRRQLAHTRQLQKCLKTLCDSEDEDTHSVRRRPIGLPIIRKKADKAENVKEKIAYKRLRQITDNSESSDSSNSTSKGDLSDVSSFIPGKNKNKTVANKNTIDDDDARKDAGDTSKSNFTLPSKKTSAKQKKLLQKTTENSNINSDSSVDSHFVRALSTKGKNKRQEENSRDTEEEEDEDDDDDDEDCVQTISINKTKKVGNASSKCRLYNPLHKGLAKPESENESSSGKEFLRSKLRRSKFKPLQKQLEIEKDNMVSDSSSTDTKRKGKTVGKSNGELLKSYFNTKLEDIRNAATLNLTRQKQKNTEQKILSQEDACKMVRTTENVINKLRKILDEAWNDMSTFYKRRYENENLVQAANDVLSDELDEKNCNKRDASPESDIVELADDSVVSDCDSKEIFSEDERKSKTSKLKSVSDQSESDSDNTSTSVSHNRTKSTKKTSTEKCNSESFENQAESHKEGSISDRSVVDNTSDDNEKSDADAAIDSETETSKSKTENEAKVKPMITDNRVPMVKIVRLKNIDNLTELSNSAIDINTSADIFEGSDENDNLPEPDRTECKETENDEPAVEITASTKESNEEKQSDSTSIDNAIEETEMVKTDDNTDEMLKNIDEDVAPEEKITNDSGTCDDPMADDNAEAVIDTPAEDKEKDISEKPDDLQSDVDVHSLSTVCNQDLEKDISSGFEHMNEGNDSGNSEVSPTSESSVDDSEEKAKLVLLLDSDTSVDLSESNEEKAVNERSSTSSDSNSDSSASDIAPTKASSVQSDRNPLKRNYDAESDTSSGTKAKKRRFELNKSKQYLDDKKLQMVSEVRIARLSKSILKQYERALERARRNVEDKELESLINLDNLKKKHKKCTVDDSDDSSVPSVRSRRRQKLHSNAEKDTLLDHLEKIENDEKLQTMDNDADKDKEEEAKAENSDILSNRNVIDLMDEKMENDAKLDLLKNSDSSSEDFLMLDDMNDKGSKSEEETGSGKHRQKTKEKPHGNSSDTSANSSKKEEGQNWRRDKLLTMKFSDTDSDKEREKWIKSRKKGALSEEDENDLKKPRKLKGKGKKSKRRILDSDSDKKASDSESESDSSLDFCKSKKATSDSEDGKKKKKRDRKRQKSSDTDSSVQSKKSKPKRKRIRPPVDDSASSSDGENLHTSQESPPKSGRKNIRKVLKDKQVAGGTKQAAKEEEDRLKRIAERQKLYNNIYEMKLANEEKVDKLILDFDPNTKEALVSVHENLVKRLKPHQAKGIKFMWDACFESLERIKINKGSGCILAHCMGLGKSLQVIALTQALLTHEETGVKTVMIICPLSTVLNWVNEFNTWLEDINNDDPVEVFELTRLKKNSERMYQLQEWQRVGGVLIIGYEMFRNLSNASKKMRKSMRESILKSLVDPGADLVVCDEGHLLKNEDTALSKCMRQVKTLRRIVLTGTPLQNNLIEYHCMVQFVKPNLLGTKKEFSNRFLHPITNGQFEDSTPADVKLMKKRAHVLHKMLEGSVQRFDYSVLTPFLPPKQEYVIFVRLTELQIKLYKYYLANFARKSRSVGGSLFADFQELQRIWTHPIVLRLSAEKAEKEQNRKYLTSDSEGSLKDFIDDGDSETSSSDSDIQSVHSDEEATAKRSLRSNPIEPQPVVKEEESKTDWWSQFVEPDDFHDIRISGKLILLFQILKESEQLGDKVLVFSQSLYSLTLIEEFLNCIDQNTRSGEPSEFLEGHDGHWNLGEDYFRLDGQTSAECRNIWCKEFNKPSNTRARLFLISTRAGGLGINLTAANRVIIFDASWNPSHDVQSIFRIYRFGQRKPCYVYRLLAFGTMEEKIYNRQVTKLSLSCRVVDEQQIERHYSNESLSELYSFEDHLDKERTAFALPKDDVLANILLKYKDVVQHFHEHDSLLENRIEEELNEEDRKQAWLEYEEEKKGRPPMAFMGAMQNGVMMQPNVPFSLDKNYRMEFEILQQLIQQDYPNLPPEMQNRLTEESLSGMYTYMEHRVASAPHQIPFARNVMNPQNIMPQNTIIAGGHINNAQNQLTLFQQQQLAMLQAQRQLERRNNFEVRAPNTNSVVQSAVINIDDTDIPTNARSAELPAQTSGNSKGQEE